MSNLLNVSEEVQLMLDAGLEPLVKYPGNSVPWKSRCLKCKSVVTPRLKQIKRGIGGCSKCGREKTRKKTVTDSNLAADILLSRGLKPLVPFTNSQTPWKSECLTCGRTVSPRLSILKRRKSGCAFCSKSRIDSNEAIKLFKSKGLEPLVPYPGNKKPWKSKHNKCGKIVSPTYQAVINNGQGPCKYCSGVAVHPEDAIKLFLSKNLKPLEPYPGDSKKPWKSIHTLCGNTVHPTYNIIQRNESMGCKHCSDQFVEPSEAFNFYISKGFQPLSPYPGSNKPWKSIHLVCGSETSPSYGKIKSGRKGCAVCSGNVKIAQEVAVSYYREKGLEPIGKFPGPNKPWKSIHKICGREVAPRWGNLHQGHSPCIYCSGGKVDKKDALELLKKLDLKPLVPYPGNKLPWECIHIPCGKKVFPRYNGLSRGQGGCESCGKNMISEQEALKLITKNNFVSTEVFPGGSKPWKLKHLKCGNVQNVYVSYLRAGGKGCSSCAGTKPITATIANKYFKSRGFKPIEKFVNSRTPMKSVHQVCGREVSPSWASLHNSGGCKYCQIGSINLIAPAFLYLMTNNELNANKIGIGGVDAKLNRIDQHRKKGWKLIDSLEFDTAERAYEVEQEVLSWLRTEIGAGQYLLPEQMPQGGHTETFELDSVETVEVWNKVIEVTRIVK